MKKLLIIFLISLIFLSGCGLYNLSNFTLPDDLEFLSLIEKLDTPKKICDYMKKNFTYEPHAFYAPDPYTLWKTGKGDCNDFATFGIFVANYHEYETYVIKIKFKNDINFSHCIAIYSEKKLSYSDNDYYEYGFDNFQEIVERVCFYRNKNYVEYCIYNYSMEVIEGGSKQWQ